MQWHYTNLRRDQLTVPQNYYQRDPSQGWGSDQQARYLKTVYQGQAATPLVANVVKAQARVMDGGHRLEALKMFTSNNVGMQVGSGDKDKRVFYCKVPPHTLNPGGTPRKRITHACALITDIFSF